MGAAASHSSHLCDFLNLRRFSIASWCKSWLSIANWCKSSTASYVPRVMAFGSRWRYWIIGQTECSAAMRRGFLQGSWPFASGRPWEKVVPKKWVGRVGSAFLYVFVLDHPPRPNPFSSPIRRLLIAHALPQPHEPPYPPLLIILNLSGRIATSKNLKISHTQKWGAHTIPFCAAFLSVSTWVRVGIIEIAVVVAVVIFVMPAIIIVSRIITIVKQEQKQCW